MKMKILIFTVLMQSVVISIFSQNIINRVELISQSPIASDSVFLVIASESFSGGCTYTANVDSIVGNTVYVSGIFDGNNKCLGRIDNDTTYLGKFKQGNYSVIYRFIDTNEYFPIPTETYTLNFEVTTGIENIRQETVSVFPNPCSSQVKITFAPPMFKCDQLQVLDSFGRILMEKRNCNSGEIIHINSFANGIYFLQIAGNNKLQTVKLVKR